MYLKNYQRKNYVELCTDLIYFFSSDANSIEDYNQPSTFHGRIRMTLND